MVIISRCARTVPLKNKTASSITSALKSLFQNRKPITIQSVKGTEFVNSTVQLYLKRQGVSFQTTDNPDIKDAIVELFNSTLKETLYKYFTMNNTYSYLDVTNKILACYNSVHSTIGMPQEK